jgi:hypothetical protein
MGVQVPISTSSGQQPARHELGSKHALAHEHAPPSVALFWTHWLPEHIWPVWQGIAQPPQLFGSLVVSVQTLLQQVVVQPLHPAEATQPPFMHCWPFGQARPHWPQLFASVIRFLQPTFGQHMSLPAQV